ncbi:hypothetical protein LJPFL01_2713 [Lelliottia jeotgali]|nr:hypothetical protein LJPFL01_2713 [Lelliottia jeotgali]
MPPFIKFKTLMQKFTMEYNSYPLGKILAVKIAAIAYQKNEFRFKDFIKLIRFHDVSFVTANADSTVFAIGAYGRNDYYQILDYVTRNKNSILVDLAKTKFKYKVDINVIVRSFINIFSMYAASDVKLKQKIYLSLELVHSINTINHLENLDYQWANVNSFCSFCSNLTGEAELHYFFKKRNIPTYTLQHGLWFIFPEPQPIDCLVYENLLADRLLCWGQYTKDEFVRFGIADSRILVTGYPRPHILNLKPKSQSSKKVLLLLARSSYDKNNKMLLQIASKLTDVYEFEYKLHPSVNASEYDSLCQILNISAAPDKDVNALLTQHDYMCTITYNSTAYYDSYVNNCISLRYKDDDYDNSVEVHNDYFMNVEELAALLYEVKDNVANENFWKEVSVRLVYILGLGIDKYSTYLGKNND